VTADDLSEANEMRCTFVGWRDLQPVRGRLARSLLPLTGQRIGRPGQVRDSPRARPKYDLMGTRVDLKVGAPPPHTRSLAPTVAVSEAKPDIAEHEACVHAAVSQGDVDADVAKSCPNAAERDG
jgi:hypothetical protein